MLASTPKRLRLGTRGSMLARTQSAWVARELEKAAPGLGVESIVFTTSGDQITERPLYEFGGKGLFTKELEQALLDDQVDFAVHSFKDMPMTMPLVEQADLIVAAVPRREDARDVLAAKAPMGIMDLPHGASVGTGSLRRRCQLLHLRPDLRIEPIRGNIDTRLRKLREGQYDAVVLAMAGILRAGLFDPATMRPIDATEILPAPGQGALALQCRRGDDRTRNVLRLLNDDSSAACVSAERELVRLLKGDCLSPIAAFAQIEGTRLHLRSAVGGRNGMPPIFRAQASAELVEPGKAAQTAFAELSAMGVEAILHGSD